MKCEINHSEYFLIMALGNVYCYAWKEGYKNIIPQQFLDSLTVESRYIIYF